MIMLICACIGAWVGHSRWSFGGQGWGSDHFDTVESVGVPDTNGLVPRSRDYLVPERRVSSV
jgi:hypothetical protein